jgi:hypothetical protein
MARKTVKTSRPKSPAVKQGTGRKRALKDLNVIGEQPKGGRRLAEGGNDAGKFDKKT